MICAISLIVSTPSNAQVCQYVTDDQGRVNNAIMVDGKPHMFFTIERSKEILKRSKDADSLDKQIVLMEQKIQLLEKSVKMERERSEFLDMRLKAEMAFFAKHNQPPKWYDSPSFTFIMGVGLSSLVYGYWNFSRR